jgi:hypothetical protein
MKHSLTGPVGCHWHRLMMGPASVHGTQNVVANKKQSKLHKSRTCAHNKKWTRQFPRKEREKEKKGTDSFHEEK